MPSILGAAIRLGAVFSESAGGLMKHLLGIGLTLSSLAADEPLECDFTDYRRLAGPSPPKLLTGMGSSNGTELLRAASLTAFKSRKERKR